MKSGNSPSLMLTFKQWLKEASKEAYKQAVIKEQAAKQPKKSLDAIIKEQIAPVPQRKTLKQIRDAIAARTK